MNVPSITGIKEKVPKKPPTVRAVFADWSIVMSVSRRQARVSAWEAQLKFTLNNELSVKVNALNTWQERQFRCTKSVMC